MPKQKEKRARTPDSAEAVYEALSPEDRALLNRFFDTMRAGEEAMAARAEPLTATNCSTCKNWLQRTAYGSGATERGWCRCDPPTHDGWPQAWGDDWCNDYSPGAPPSVPGPHEARA